MRFKLCASFLLLLLQNEWVNSEEEIWTWDLERQDNGREIFFTHEDYADPYPAAASDLSSDYEADVMVFPSEDIDGEALGRQDNGRNIFFAHEDYADSYHAAASDLSEVVVFPSDDEADVMVFPSEDIDGEAQESREGRFLGIGKGIRCSFGIGKDCEDNRRVQKPNGHNQLGHRPKPQTSFFPTENNQDHHIHSPHRFDSPVKPTQIPSSGILDSISSAFSSILPSIGQQKPKPSEADRAYSTIKHHPYKIPQSSHNNPKPSSSVHKPNFSHQKPVYPPKPAYPPKPVFKSTFHEPRPLYDVVNPAYADPKVTVVRQPMYVVQQPTYVQAQVPTLTVAAAPLQHAPVHIQQQPHTYIVQAAPVIQPNPVTVTQTVTRAAFSKPVINNRNDVFVSSGNSAQQFLQQSPGYQDLLSQSTLYRETIEYLEDCQCITYDYCSLNDVIGRSLNVDPSNVIDARKSEQNHIESNATETDTAETKTITYDSEISEVTENSTLVESNITRRKRSDDEPSEASEIQGRQLTGFTPDKHGCGDGYVCCRRPVYKPKPRYQCGRSNSKGLLGRVKNPLYEEGDTEFGEYPWQAAILKRENNAVNYVCGAVLIDNRHILTAAHCIDGISVSNLKVRLGEWDVANKDEFFSHVELPVSQLYINQEYTKGTLENDIALLRLSSNIDFTTHPHIAPVCLPDKFSGFRQDSCMVTGWGKDAFDTTGKFQHILKKVSLPLVEHYQCQNALRSTRLGPSYSLHEGMVCAGGEESQDACKGDGGSPLACKSLDGSYQLAGLVSWGIGCGQRGIPGVYVNVRYYLDWIKSIQNYN